MSDKKKNWNNVKWTTFQEAVFPPTLPAHLRPHVVYRNSIYQVSVWMDKGCEPFGPIIHLSFKTNDKQARHDWREMQRIKNEIVGEEIEAVEVFPAESRLVDTANQFHIYCFPQYRLPFGFQERLVAEGDFDGAKQRPFPHDFKPEDLATREDMQQMIAEYKKKGSPKGRCPFDGTPMFEEPETVNNETHKTLVCQRGIHKIVAIEQETK